MAHIVRMAAILSLNVLDDSLINELSSNPVFQARIDIHSPATLYIFEVDEKNIHAFVPLEVGIHTIVYITTTEIPCTVFNEALVGVYTKIYTAIDFIDTVAMAEMETNDFVKSDDDKIEMRSKIQEFRRNNLERVEIAASILEGMVSCLTSKASPESNESKLKEKDEKIEEPIESVESFISSLTKMMERYSQN